MTQQLDMIPLDAAALEHAAEYLPTAREVTAPRLRLDTAFAICACGYCNHLRARGEQQERALDDARRFDVGHELVLPERAREDHR